MPMIIEVPAAENPTINDILAPDITP